MYKMEKKETAKSSGRILVQNVIFEGHFERERGGEEEEGGTTFFPVMHSTTENRRGGERFTKRRSMRSSRS